MDDAYQRLYAETMQDRRASFPLQYIVDAYAAQTAAAGDKPIRLVFALVGLYLHLERRFDGRQVQLAHMTLGRRKRTWPSIALPAERGPITPTHVLAAPPGPDRDRAIDDWCRSAWDAFVDSRPAIESLLRAERII